MGSGTKIYFIKKCPSVSDIDRVLCVSKWLPAIWVQTCQSFLVWIPKRMKSFWYLIAQLLLQRFVYRSIGYTVYISSICVIILKWLIFLLLLLKAVKRFSNLSLSQLKLKFVPEEHAFIEAKLRKRFFLTWYSNFQMFLLLLSVCLCFSLCLFVHIHDIHNLKSNIHRFCAW